MTKTQPVTALELRPTCPSNPAHGYMALRQRPQTKEQQWCGVWYDCQQCHSSALYPSEALKSQNNEAFGRITRHYQSLRGKRQQERYLTGCAPWVADALREGRSYLYE